MMLIPSNLRLRTAFVFLLLCNLTLLGFAEAAKKSDKFVAVDAAVERAIQDGQIPGAVRK